MKYDSLRNIERNNLLIWYHNSHPELSLREVGKAFNISKQAVSKIERNPRNRQLAGV